MPQDCHRQTAQERHEGPWFRAFQSCREQDALWASSTGHIDINLGVLVLEPPPCRRPIGICDVVVAVARRRAADASRSSMRRIDAIRDRLELDPEAALKMVDDATPEEAFCYAFGCSPVL